MQWNVWYEEDARHIVKFLEAHPADIICLQELAINCPKRPIGDVLVHITQELDYDYHYKKLLFG